MQKIMSRSRYRFLISLLVLQTIVLVVVLSINYSNSSLAYANKSLETKDSIPTVAVELEKMNVVYTGLSNPLTVAVAGYKNEEVSLEVSGGGGWKLTPQGNGKYSLFGEGFIRELTLSIFITNGKDKVFVGANKYRVKSIPEPIVQLGTIDGSRPIPREVISSQRTVFASLGFGTYTMVKYTVTNYTAIAKYNRPNQGVTYDTMNIEGSSFTNTKRLTDSLRSGDMLMIKNVKAIGPEGEKELFGIRVEIR